MSLWLNPTRITGCCCLSVFSVCGDSHRHDSGSPIFGIAPYVGCHNSDVILYFIDVLLCLIFYGFCRLYLLYQIYRICSVFYVLFCCFLVLFEVIDCLGKSLFFLYFLHFMLYFDNLQIAQ